MMIVSTTEKFEESYLSEGFVLGQYNERYQY